MASIVPTISLDSGRDAQHIAKEIRGACLSNGFFQVIDWGAIIPKDLPTRTLALSRRFFDLPLTVKEALFKADHIAGGYEPYKAMNLNPIDSNGYGHNEGFSFAGPPHPTAWPAKSQLPEFEETMMEYYAGVTALSKRLGQYIALGLNLPEDYFESFFTRQLAHVKLAHYYRPETSGNGELNVGVASHTDWGAITVLLQDDVGGLEVFDHDSSQWISVLPTPGAFVINLGDLLARWTNGLYKSTRHRVITPPAGIHRYSIPFFCQGHPDYIVRVIESCVKEGEAIKYGPIRAEDYLRMKFESTYLMAAGR